MTRSHLNSALFGLLITAACGDSEPETDPGGTESGSTDGTGTDSMPSTTDESNTMPSTTDDDTTVDPSSTGGPSTDTTTSSMTSGDTDTDSTGTDGTATGSTGATDDTGTTGMAGLVIESLSPADDAVAVLPSTNFQVTFNENVVIGTGNVVLHRASDDSVVETIDVTGGLVTAGGALAIINPAATLDEGTEYYLLIDATAFDGDSGAEFGGLDDPTAWSFTTDDITAPGLVSLDPEDDATGVLLQADLVLTFDEDVQAGSGDITVRLSSNGTVVETVDVTGAQVSVAGPEATVDLASGLQANTGFYVTVATGAIEDLAGNAYVGFAGSTAWNFTTGDPLAPIINEVLHNPPGDPDTDNEYVELRGEAGTTIGAGTYLVQIEGDGAGAGSIDAVIDVSGLTFGANGTIALVDADTPYTVDADATVSEQSIVIENGSVTLLLVEAGVAPSLATDVDSNDDGTLDGAATNWTVLDAIGVLDGGNIDVAYGAINYSADGDGLVDGGLVVDLSSIDNGFNPDYLMRVGDSVGQAAADWMASDLEGTVPDLTVDAVRTTEAGLAGAALDHFGAPNPSP